jgi:hypothetical protein
MSKAIEQFYEDILPEILRAEEDTFYTRDLDLPDYHISSLGQSITQAQENSPSLQDCLSNTKKYNVRVWQVTDRVGLGSHYRDYLNGDVDTDPERGENSVEQVAAEVHDKLNAVGEMEETELLYLVNSALSGERHVHMAEKTLKTGQVVERVRNYEDVERSPDGEYRRLDQ